MPKKKLLHICLGNENVNMYDSFDKHFTTIHLDWTKFINIPNNFNVELKSLFDDFKPHIVFMQIQCDILDYNLLDYMTKKSITIYWNGDVRSPIPNYDYEFSKRVDLALFVNTEYVNTLRSHGINANYLNIGYDSELYNPTGSVSKKYGNIVFMGNNYGFFPLSNLRSNLVKELKDKYGSKFKVYGNSWGNDNTTTTNREEEAEAYRSCKIAINLSHFDYGRYSSDRLNKILGCGAFCLSHHFKDIDKDYNVGKHLDTWHTIRELKKKIDYYLSQEEKRNKIAYNGYLLASKKHTWNNFVINLKKMI